jgi:protein-disulfide isomerase
MGMEFWKPGRLSLQGIAVGLLMVASLMAQAPAQEDLPGIDLSGLSAAQKATALKLIRDQGCSCGCAMKIGECRVKDPACTYSKGLATVMIEAITKGGTEADAIQAAAKSQFSHPPGESNRILEDPVTIATQGAPVLGPKDAPITLIEFSDFQCPYCVAAVPQLQAVMKAFPTQVKLIFKQYPLENHSEAAFAAAAALAAHRQGKFWAMHDALFAHHEDLSKESVFAIARNLGLNMTRFETDLDSASVQQSLQNDIADGDRAGVPGTPTLFVDGQRFNGPLTLDTLKPVLENELKQGHGPLDTASATTGK